MKRCISLFIICLTLFAAGCKNGSVINLPIKFYYPNATLSYGTQEGLFSNELREGSNKTAQESISEYLKGPSDHAFSNPFPTNTILLEYELKDDTAYLILSDNYAQLTGLDLSIANTCLSMTVLELTGALSVSISCESARLDGQTSVIMNQYSALLYDSSKSTAPTESVPTPTDK